jgi:hypothetical protein
MKAWIANLLWDALGIFLGRLHDWIFDLNRAVRGRFRNREIWWRYYCKAKTTGSKRDDMRAEWYRIHFAFKTSPEEAVKRGDLEPINGFRGR